MKTRKNQYPARPIFGFKCFQRVTNFEAEMAKIKCLWIWDNVRENHLLLKCHISHSGSLEDKQKLLCATYIFQQNF